MHAQHRTNRTTINIIFLPTHDKVSPKLGALQVYLLPVTLYDMKHLTQQSVIRIRPLVDIFNLAVINLREGFNKEKHLFLWNFP